MLMIFQIEVKLRFKLTSKAYTTLWLTIKKSHRVLLADTYDGFSAEWLRWKCRSP